MEEYYKKAKGTAGLNGIQFQVSLTTVFLLNALRGLKGWRISTENLEAGKFDDIVLQLQDGSAVLLQAKHKDTKRVTRSQLFSDNSKNADFSLPKYFLSYQDIKSRFKVKNVIICTNADIDKKKLGDILTFQCACPDHILHYQGGNCCFANFNENILSCLKKAAESYYDKNMQGKGIDREVISEENMKEFLGKLQFFTNYPSGDKLHTIIDRLLASITDCKIWRDISSQEIYRKIEKWFKHESCEYLTEALAQAIVSVIKNGQYCKLLTDYNVSFQSNDVNFTKENRIFHVDVEAGHLLQVLKIYKALKGKNTLYIDFDDHVHKSMIGAFDLPKYNFLVLICTKIKNYSAISEIKHKLKEILENHNTKKIILIGSSQLLNQLELKYEVVRIDSCVTIEDLTDETRKILINKKKITFQGEDFSLEELLKVTPSEKLKAVNSDMLEKLVRNERVKVGKTLQGLNEETLRYYIDRIIEREIYDVGDETMSYKKKKEILTVENIFGIREKVILISDSAGTGKSTVLSKLASDIKKNYPHLWIIRIELNNYTRILRDFSRKKRKSIKITELLNSNDATKLINHLEEIVFSTKEKVVMMLDGFDEISPDYTELVLNLLGQCREATNFAKVIVTSRPNMNEKLERTLQVKPYVLKPFTRADQIEFLTRYWTHNLELDESCKEKCEKYSVILINKISFWINEKNDFAGVPLQVRMLAEIFKENICWSESADWEGCKEFLQRDGSEPDLPERMKVTELYDMFIKKKLDIFIDKINPCGTALGNSLTSLFDRYFVNHQSLALEIILGSSSILDKGKCSLFSRYRYDGHLEAAMLKIGIVQKVNGKINFVHRTFAEYFVAKSILDVSELHNQSLNQNLDFQQFFIDEILCNLEFTVVRSFIESILNYVVDVLPSNVFDNYKLFTSSNPRFWESQSKLVHLLAREGCIAILQLILKCIHFEVVKEKEVCITELKEIIKIENCNTLTILDCLAQRCGVNIKTASGDTPLHLAAESGRLEMIKFLMELGGNIKSKTKSDITLLHSAATFGHLHLVEFLVECGLDADISDNCGFSSLHVAALRGHLDTVNFLAHSGASLHALNKDGCTPLLLASWKNHLKTVQSLVEFGTDFNIGDNNEFTAFHATAQHGHLDIFRYFVECGADIHSSNNIGFSALHIAAQENNLHIIKFLAQCGVDFNIRTVKGSTSLHIAAMRGHLDVVEFLSKYVDVNARNNHGITALYLAAEKNHPRVVQFLAEQGADIHLGDNCGHTSPEEVGETAGHTPLYWAVYNGNLEMVKLLVSHKAQVNVISKGHTALHAAVLQGHLELVKFLIENGADVTLINSNTYNALHLAAYNGKLEIVTYLKETNADINAENIDGCNALHLSSWKGHLDVVQYLIQQGMDVNKCDKGNGIASLHAASLYGHLDIIKLLVQSGAVVNAEDNNGYTSLHNAAKENYPDAVQFLIQSGANVNGKNHEGFTALHLAAQEGHVDIVKHLANEKIDVSATNNKGFTALHSAACNGHNEVVKILLENRANVNFRSSNGCIPLHLAAQKGHLDTVQVLVQHGANIADTDEEGFTALLLASREGHHAVVKILAEAGADINLTNNNGCSSLYLASWKGHLLTVQSLVKQGMDINIGDKFGFTPLQAATQHGHLDIVDFFVERGGDINSGDSDGFTPLHIAAQQNHLHILRYLVNCGAHINSRTKHGSTPLHTASWNGNLEIAQYLVKSGVNIEAKNNIGLTALHLAAKKAKLDVIGFLLDQGVDINAESSTRCTALHAAVQQGHSSIVKFLTERGASTNIEDDEGCTVLHLACRQNQLDIVKLLIDAGDCVNLRNSSGATALHFATWKGCLEITKFLTERGADINAIDDAGFTPLHLAAQEGHLDILKLFTKRRADINVVNRTGCTPLHLATLRGHLNVVQCLVEQEADISVDDNNGTNFHDIDHRDNEGLTAVHLAAQLNQSQIMETLLKRGADCNVRSKSGSTPLHLAAVKGHLDAVKILVMRNAQIDVIDEQGCTAFEICARSGHLESLQFLVKFGVDLNVRNAQGGTALHSAVREGHLEVVKFLVKSGLSVNSRDCRGFTTLHSAAQRGNLDSVKFLLDCGVDANAASNEGITALHLAAEEGHLDTVKFLISTRSDVNIKNSDGKRELHLAMNNQHLHVADFLIEQEKKTTVQLEETTVQETTGN